MLHITDANIQLEWQRVAERAREAWIILLQKERGAIQPVPTPTREPAWHRLLCRWHMVPRWAH